MGIFDRFRHCIKEPLGIQSSAVEYSLLKRDRKVVEEKTLQRTMSMCRLH